ncbi:nucleotidyltransferase family protein [Microbulbifer flavimaris]|uniref:Nucleotidyltransferase family protein n=1 Tax=Microbulbifer flavimaris TaxID=1781068 RepID=A0ABX4HVE0_9GAMM|nr:MULTISPECIES: nucleotidyltransferase family protein [Microbulbifer]PCO04079.1 nucleotidyltransferase family protein [Microbulbifer flavimaris]
MRYGALILAGGYSRRFRSDKRLASVEGEPMLAATLGRVRLALADHPGSLLQVVVRARDPLVEHLLVQRGVFPVHAPPWPVGVGASIAKGSEALLQADPHLDVIAVVPADMPYLRPEILSALLLQSERRSITVPVCLGEVGEVVTVGAELFPDLLSLSVRHGLKKLLRNRAERVRYQLVDDTTLIRSIDSPADFQAAIQPDPADKNFGIPRRDLRGAVATRGE